MGGRDLIYLNNFIKKPVNKQTKYRPTRKKLTHEQANIIFQNCQQSICASTDNINYWLSKKKEDGLFHIDRCDIFILNVDNLNSPNELIKIEQENILFMKDKMDDMKRFFESNKKILSIF